MKWNHPAAWIYVCLAMALSVPCWGMGFCAPPSPRLREFVANSKIVFLGVVCQAHEDADGNGTTEFHIRHVFKNDPLLGRKKIVYLPFALPSPKKGPSRYLLFA